MEENGISRREMLAATAAAAIATVAGTSAVAGAAQAANEQAEVKQAKMAPGKIYVVADANGTVIGTARIGDNLPKDGPVPGRPTPGEGQKVHEIDFTPELQKVQHPTELHKAVARLIK